MEVVCAGIIGIGIDIVDVRRITALWERHPERFVHRILSEEEYVNLTSNAEPLSAVRLAGRWAAKEAVSKAMGCGFTGFGFSDIVILNSDGGMPFVRLRAGAAAAAAQSCIGHIKVSISHEREMAIAQAMAFTQGTLAGKLS